MCTTGCIAFATRILTRSDVEGKRVLEVGSYDVNGTLRGAIDPLNPASYTGVDMAPGPGVDQVCLAEGLIDRFGPESFDVVLSTEMLEHVQDWRTVIDNMKGVLAIGGILVLTTRSKGFQFHGYPVDFWRFSLSDMRVIFSDMTIEALESDDPISPGVMIRAKRTQVTTRDLRSIRVYSVVRRCRANRATRLDYCASVAIGFTRNVMTRILPSSAKRVLRDSAVTVGRAVSRRPRSDPR